MLGWLTVWFALWFQQDPAQEPFFADLKSLEALLEAPQYEDQDWRVSVWVHLTRLEHAPVERVLPGWEALARTGLDSDLANLYVYQRRHSLDLLNVPVDAGQELTLEACLEAWARSDFSEAKRRLEAALKRFPDDDRLRSNLDWLLERSPQVVQFDGSARHLALVALAARRPLS